MPRTATRTAFLTVAALLLGACADGATAPVTTPTITRSLTTPPPPTEANTRLGTPAPGNAAIVATGQPPARDRDAGRAPAAPSLARISIQSSTRGYMTLPSQYVSCMDYSPWGGARQVWIEGPRIDPMRVEERQRITYEAFLLKYNFQARIWEQVGQQGLDRYGYFDVGVPFPKLGWNLAPGPGWYTVKFLARWWNLETYRMMGYAEVWPDEADIFPVGTGVSGGACYFQTP